ncbi:MAG: ClpXP protease specificity-enhancing factor SspB [Hyphomicrobiaceae bacterium]|jgi:hypothetical protein|nr:ClpXP protease specificity-enhancing factor SspB [Hyphomicrobiaceae bacterium]
MTSEPTIDYEALTQDAMRGVVRTVLTRIAKTGLPGDHHFYISFDTEHPGSSLSKRLREKYPREMTIVLQHRFWDLVIHDERFEVKLTFDGIPERLVVPFEAIKVFFDPSVRYGLQFDDPETGTDPDALVSGNRDVETRVTATRSSGPRKPRTPKKPRAESDKATSPLPQREGKSSAPVPIKPAGDQPAPEKESETASADGEKPQSGATIVSLDQFRKK